MAEETRAEAVVENPDGAAEDYDYGYNEECERITVLAHGVSLRRVNVTAEAAPFDLSYRPSRVLLYSPPRQRQKWGDTQVLPRVNWGDLFFDLFYVAATYNVSNIIFDSPNKEGLLYAAGTFLPVMGIWSQKTYYDARYVTEADVFHRLLTIFILVVLGVAVSHIRPVTSLSDAAGESSIFVFTLMLVVERLFALTLYMEVYFRGVGQKQIKSASLRDARLHTFSLPFYVAAMSIAAIEYFGDGISGARRLAEVVEVTTSDYDTLHALNETTNIPIFLCLFGYVGSVIIFGFNIIFCFPGGGRHKEM
jgi:Bacterial low temperature requirement A protein (LtrA)